MIDQIRSNILQEATNILKVQNNKNEFGVSFDELFKINTDNSLNNIDNNDAQKYEVEININENYDKPYQDKLNENEVDDKSLEKQKSNLTKSAGKNKVKDAPSETDDKKNKTINGIGQDITTNHTILKNKSAEKKDLNVTLKFKNIELKPELDSQTKQKVKRVLEDLKNGRINENIASEFILQIIKNAHIKDVASLKNKATDVKIKNSSKNEKAFSLNVNNKKNKIEPDKQNTVSKIKNSESNNIDDSLFKSKNIAKTVGKKESVNKLEVKNEENGKELKTEVKLELIDNKMPNVNNVRDRVMNEPQKILENNRENLFQEIAKNTKIVLGQNQTRFSTMIRPENFGRIDFNFVVKDGKVNGRMILQNKEVADFFRANVEDIRAVFQKSNVELENIDIILAGNRFGELSHNNENNRESTQNENFILTNNGSINKKYIDVFEENISSHQQYYSRGENSRINLVV